MNYKKILKTNDYEKIGLIVPLALAVALIPLIFGFSRVEVDHSIQNVWRDSKITYDFFAYIKSVCIIAISVVVMALMAFNLIVGNTRVKVYKIVWVCIFGYSLAVVLSAVFSHYRNVSFKGFPDRYEGMFILLCYMILLAGTMIMVCEEKQIRIILNFFLVSGLVICIIGIFQYFNLDFFRTDIGKTMLFQGNPGNYLSKVKFKFGENTEFKNIIYSTLNNPNTFGMYIAMLFPISFAEFLRQSNNLKRFVYGFYNCIVLACVIGSCSRAAYIAAVVSGVIIVTLLRKRLWESKMWLIPVVLVYVFLIITMNGISRGNIYNRAASIVNLSEIKKSINNTIKISDFKISGNKVAIYSGKEILNIGVKGKDFVFSDTKGIAIRAKKTNKDYEYTFEDERYAGFYFAVAKEYFSVKRSSTFVNFRIEGNEIVPADVRGNAVKVVYPDKFGFEGIEKLASARGYIWSRSIPLLNKTLFTGTGPDTFAAYFPQNDFHGKLKTGMHPYIIIDKPHNMYLQTAINTGIFSLVFLLIIYCTYLYTFILKLRKADLSASTVLFGTGLFAAVTGYLITGITTDSTVSTAPVFWVLLGCGFVTNFLSCNSGSILHSRKSLSNSHI